MAMDMSWCPDTGTRANSLSVTTSLILVHFPIVRQGTTLGSFTSYGSSLCGSLVGSTAVKNTVCRPGFQYSLQQSDLIEQQNGKKSKNERDISTVTPAIADRIPSVFSRFFHIFHHFVLFDFFQKKFIFHFFMSFFRLPGPGRP